MHLSEGGDVLDRPQDIRVELLEIGWRNPVFLTRPIQVTAQIDLMLDRFLASQSIARK
jgi:hypothetical protein